MINNALATDDADPFKEPVDPTHVDVNALAFFALTYI